LQVGSFHYYPAWFSQTRAWVNKKSEVDGLVVTGNMCNLLRPTGAQADQSIAIKDWIGSLRCPVFYAPGGWDPQGMEDWELPNLHLCGEHVFAGWRIHVMSAFARCEEIQPTTSQTIIVSHHPPALTRCAVGPDGTHYGRMDVREAVATAGDCRLVLCGHVMDPLSQIDWCENAMVINVGASFWEHEPHDAPAFAMIDTDTRSVTVDNGRRLASHSFAR